MFSLLLLLAVPQCQATFIAACSRMDWYFHENFCVNALCVSLCCLRRYRSSRCCGVCNCYVRAYLLCVIRFDDFNFDLFFPFRFSFTLFLSFSCLISIPFARPCGSRATGLSCSLCELIHLYSRRLLVYARFNSNFFRFFPILHETVSFFIYMYYIFIRFFPLCERLFVRSLRTRLYSVVVSCFFSVFLFWLSGWIRIRNVWLYMRMYNSVVYLCTKRKFNRERDGNNTLVPVHIIYQPTFVIAITGCYFAVSIFSFSLTHARSHS